MISELFIKQKTWLTFVSFLTEQSLIEREIKREEVQMKHPFEYNLPFEIILKL